MDAELARLAVSGRTYAAVEAAQRAEAQQQYQAQERASVPIAAPAAELVNVPSFFSSPVGWLEATLINAGRQNETVRKVLTATLAPAADKLISVGQTRQEVVDAVVRGYEGFKIGIEATGALVSYSFAAVREGRWEDARRAAAAWWRLPGATVDAITQTYDEQPLLAQVGVSMAPGGDLIDVAREGRRFVKGEDVDELVLGLSVVGLVMDLGVLDGPLPDPADAGNLAAGGIKAIIKAMPDGVSRRLLEEMLADPAQWEELVQTINALMSHQDELGALLRNDEALAAVIRTGPEAVDLVARYGDEGVALLVWNQGQAQEMLRFLSRTPDPAGDLASRSLQALRSAGRLADVGIGSDEAAEIAKRIASACTQGSGERVVIGRWVDPSRWAEEGGGYLQEVAERGGVYFETPPGLYDALGRNPDLAWEVNERFLRNQLERGRPIELAGDVAETLQTAAPDAFRRREIEFLLENAGDYGYILDGNIWGIP